MLTDEYNTPLECLQLYTHSFVTPFFSIGDIPLICFPAGEIDSSRIDMLCGETGYINYFSVSYFCFVIHPYFYRCLRIIAKTL